MSFRLCTLGCKVNQYETELVREGLLQIGCREAEGNDAADIIVVNTCTVTAESDWKSRKTVRKLIRENPAAHVAVMGCSAVKEPEIYRQIGGVSEVVTDKRCVPAFLQRLGLTQLPNSIRSFAERHRAYVKVQDGCRVGCSYCIIPKVRPVSSSRSEEDIINEIEQLSRNGYREIVLTGIHLGHYGKESTGGKNLAALLRRIVQRDEPFRIRLSSLEAVEVSDELVDVMLEHPNKVCPHLHLSMQSGSDSVLRRMKRRWLSEPFIRRCKELQGRLEHLALTTDVIVGFPGETDSEFEQTCAAVRELGFSKVHIFRFSPREGTEAALLPNRIPPTVQRQRAEKLETITQELRERYAASLCGMTLSVLLETVHGGTTDRYVKMELKHPVDAARLGQLLRVRAEQVQGVRLLGEQPDHITSPPPTSPTVSVGLPLVTKKPD